MLYTPSILRTNLFNDLFDDDFFTRPFGHLDSFQGNAGELMRTDVREDKDVYELQMSLPGIDKKDIKASLKDGYMTISASTSNSNDEKDKNHHYIRRERYQGSVSRTFYVGEAVKEEDIKAKYENGILTLTVPKKVEEPKVEEQKYIAIEG
jgi:HSP20 family molecular chaperone IbpA